MKRVVLVLFLAVFVAGCPKEPYRASLQASDDVAAAVHAAIDYEMKAYGQGVVGDDEKAKASDYLTIVTQGNLAFRHCVVASHTAGGGKTGFLSCASAFVDQVGSAGPQVLHYKSADSQKLFDVYIKAVQAAINGISLAIQAAKGA